MISFLVGERRRGQIKAGISEEAELPLLKQAVPDCLVCEEYEKILFFVTLDFRTNYIFIITAISENKMSSAESNAELMMLL